MMSKPLWLIALLLCLPLMAQGPGGPGGPGGPPPPPPPLPPAPNPGFNPTTPAKVVLGKILFWDEQLSSEGTVACGTCHLPEMGGGDPRPAQHPGFDGLFGTPDDGFTSLGVIRSDASNAFESHPEFGLRPQATRRAPPTMINAAYAPRLFWDGRAGPAFRDPVSGQVIATQGGALEEQATNPPVGSDEMAHDARQWAEILNKLGAARPLRLATDVPADMASALASRPTYPDLFQAAFGSQQITGARVAMALAAYQRTLIADQTPWDAFNAGNQNALTPQQQNGLGVFAGPGRCGVCHTPPFFTNHGFRNVGLRPLQEDQGRFEITGNPGDSGRFKVPNLRNVALRPRFMHNGEFTTLQEVVNFYGGNGRFPQNQDPVVQQIAMNPQQRAALVDFLTNGLTDPRVASGLPPFDRPTLWSEGPRNPTLGPGAPGQGGIVPVLVAPGPANLANPDFRLGIGRARGGAPTWLAISTQSLPAGLLVAGLPLVVDPSDPAFFMLPSQASTGGAGEGVVTYALPLPEAPALAGLTFWAQGFVVDPAAPGLGLAATPGTRLEIF